MNGASIDECMGPLWKPSFWNTLNDVEHLNNTNCYSYAMDRVTFGEEKLQPGESSTGRFEHYTCEEIIQKMMNDNPNIMRIDEIDTPIDSDSYRIALVVDDNPENNDYHFYRQDCNGIWSHKTGTNDVTNKDATGEDTIYNPERADRDYTINGDDEHHYNVFCGYFKVPFKGETTIK